MSVAAVDAPIAGWIASVAAVDALTAGWIVSVAAVDTLTAGYVVSVAAVDTLSPQVEGSDTLMSLAARFDTTPSELTKLNRLSSRHLFSGQSLLVPLKVPSSTAFLDVGELVYSP